MKIRNSGLAVCVFMAIAFCFCKTTLAELVSTSLTSFTENTTTRYESFEETVNYASGNVKDRDGCDYAGQYVMPGTLSAYTFSQSGAKLITVPNVQNTKFQSQVVVVHAKFSYSFNQYGGLSQSSPTIDGTHFIVQFTVSSESSLPYTFELPYNVSSIGGYWFCSGRNEGSDQIQINLYDDGKNLIASEHVIAASVSDKDWSNNFAGWTTSDNLASIRYISISCADKDTACHAGVDMLMFSVPEPSTIILTIIAGFFSAFYFLLRKKSA